MSAVEIELPEASQAVILWDLSQEKGRVRG
jgi:hypothetical protein